MLADIRDYRVILVDLPTDVRGYTVKGRDDFYLVVLNAKLNHEQNLKTYWHELKHIQHDDFYSLLSADQIEAMRR